MADCDQNRRTLAERELDEVAGGSGSRKYKANCKTCGWQGDTFENKYKADMQAMDHNMINHFTHDVTVSYATS